MGKHKDDGESVLRVREGDVRGKEGRVEVHEGKGGLEGSVGEGYACHFETETAVADLLHEYHMMAHNLPERLMVGHDEISDFNHVCAALFEPLLQQQ